MPPAPPGPPGPPPARLPPSPQLTTQDVCSHLGSYLVISPTPLCSDDCGAENPTFRPLAALPTAPAQTASLSGARRASRPDALAGQPGAGRQQVERDLPPGADTPPRTGRTPQRSGDPTRSPRRGWPQRSPGAAVRVAAPGRRCRRGGPGSRNVGPTRAAIRPFYALSGSSGLEFGDLGASGGHQFLVPVGVAPQAPAALGS